MSEQDEQRGGIELLLREPEIVAWLDDRRRPEPDDPHEDDEPPAAA